MFLYLTIYCVEYACKAVLTVSRTSSL